MTTDINHVKKVFMIGVGGVGISALGQMFISRGVEVGGLNDEESPKTLDPLRALGSHIILEKDFESLPEADVYIYSDAWLFRGPQILEAAKATGKPVMSYFEALGLIAKDYKIIAIAGTHGKTTTTAMSAEALEAGSIDPTVVVGSIVKKFGSNFKHGNSEVEADEFNRHFLHFHPYISVITNVEADHLDCYKDLEDIQNAFSTFLDQTQRIVICDPKDPNVIPILADKDLTVIDYTQYLSRLPKLSVPGDHNRKNAAAALAVAECVGVPSLLSEPALAQFQGTWRRLEEKGVTAGGAIVYDDYAHHPTEVRASLQALREAYPNKKITVLFQPHLYSRTKALFEDFVTAFTGADSVYFLPIYFAREAPDPSVSSELLAEKIDGAKAFSNFEEAEVFLKNKGLGTGDVLVTMGAGEAYKIADKLLK